MGDTQAILDEAELEYEREERLARENGLPTTHADETQQWLDEMSANLDAVIKRNKKLIADNARHQADKSLAEFNTLAQQHEDAAKNATFGLLSESDESDDFITVQPTKSSALTKALHKRMRLNAKTEKLFARLTPAQKKWYDQLLKEAELRLEEEAEMKRLETEWEVLPEDLPGPTWFDHSRDAVHWSARKARNATGYVWSLVPSFRREY